MLENRYLFRGKSIYTKVWIYGYLTSKDCIEEVEVIPETVSQFTGLTDKNGVKVFESDRLRDDYFDYEMIIEGYVTVVWDLENGQWAVDNSFKQDGSSFTNLVDYVGLDNLEVLK